MSHQSQNSSFNLTPSQSPMTALPYRWWLLFAAHSWWAHWNWSPMALPDLTQWNLMKIPWDPIGLIQSHQVESFENPPESHGGFESDPTKTTWFTQWNPIKPNGILLKSHGIHGIYPMMLMMLNNLIWMSLIFENKPKTFPKWSISNEILTKKTNAILRSSQRVPPMRLCPPWLITSPPLINQPPCLWCFFWWFPHSLALFPIISIQPIVQIIAVSLLLKSHL